MSRLGPDDRLPLRPSRVLVAGTSGSGKTTLAAAMGMRLGVPYVEIDALFHGPNWTPRPAFEGDVRALAASSRWVAEYPYEPTRPLLLARTDLLVALDLSRARVMSRVVKRTVQRSWRRQALWNGNVEGPLRTILTDRDHIIRWAWRTHHRLAGRLTEIGTARPDVPMVVLRRPRDAKRWLAGPLADVAAGLSRITD